MSPSYFTKSLQRCNAYACECACACACECEYEHVSMRTCLSLKIKSRWSS